MEDSYMWKRPCSFRGHVSSELLQMLSCIGIGIFLRKFLNKKIQETYIRQAMNISAVEERLLKNCELLRLSWLNDLF